LAAQEASEGESEVEQKCCIKPKILSSLKTELAKMELAEKNRADLTKTVQGKSSKNFFSLISMFYFQLAGPVVDQAAKKLTKERQVAPTAALFIPAFRFFMKG
jgi:hypothetical protein